MVTGEITPPTTARLGAFFRRAEAVSRFARSITVTNNHGGVARLDSLAACGFLVRRGIEPLWVAVTRDKNRLALESDLLAAEALDVRNMLCLRGDTFPPGSDIRAVHDTNTLGLIRMAARQRDAGAPLHVGAAIDLTSLPTAKAVEMAVRRVDAGAEFLLTQPVYEAERVAAFLDAVESRLSRPPHLIVGMMPLLSRDAVERVPKRLRIEIADHIVGRIAHADDPKTAGLDVFSETLRELRALPGVHGVNLMLFGFTAEIAEEVAGLIRQVIRDTPESARRGR